jgi:hypothetical protein
MSTRLQPRRYSCKLTNGTSAETLPSNLDGGKMVQIIYLILSQILNINDKSLWPFSRTKEQMSPCMPTTVLSL